jgi:hypothetical protein
MEVICTSQARVSDMLLLPPIGYCHVSIHGVWIGVTTFLSLLQSSRAVAW